MKKNDLQIRIPTSCHENWDTMTPTEIGKFCSSCQKEVIDFSRMSDQEIRRILNSSKETPCGRFNTNQIERPLVAEVPVNRSLTWMKYVASLLLAFQGTNAISQTTNTTINPKIEDESSKDLYQTIEITGIILDSETKIKIEGVKIMLMYHTEIKQIYETDTLGKFILQDIHITSDSIKNYYVQISKLVDGYQPVEYSLSDFLKTKRILLSRIKTTLIPQKETVEIKIMGDIIPIKTSLKPKKKWYQIWKK